MATDSDTDSSEPAKSMLATVMSLRKEVPKVAQAFVAIAIILLLAVFALSQWGPKDQTAPIAFLIWLSVLALVIALALIVLMAFKELRSSTRDLTSVVEELKEVRRSLTIIGVHLGRTYIEGGAFDVEATISTRSYSMKQSMLGATVKHIFTADPVAYPNDAALLFSTAETIVTTARAVRHEVPDRLPIGGIAVALPGLLDIPNKLVTMSAKGLPQNTAVAQRLAEYIRKITGIEAEKLFGAQYSGSDSELAQLIFLDNDAKAVARKYVWDYRAVTDVACLIVDEGLGGGCVSSGSLIYGHQYSAGEVGHQILPLADVPVPSNSEHTDQRVATFLQSRAQSTCSCGGPGLHWEMTSNGEALLEAIRLFNPDVVETLAARLGKANASIRFADIVDVALARSVNVNVGPLTQAEFARFDETLEDVARLLAIPLGVGIANLSNVLDLEQVILTGRVTTIIEKQLTPILQQCVTKYGLNRKTNVGVVFYPKLVQDIWEGAVLLFLDAGYSRLFPAGGNDSVQSSGNGIADHGQTPSPQGLFLAGRPA